MAYKLMKGLKPIKQKRNLEIFYSIFAIWMLPLILIHELIHCFFALILNVKILSFKIYKNEKLYNGIVKIKLPNKKWKQFIISYSPMILTFPFFFMFSSVIAFYISIYLISTITSYHGKYIYVFLPSRNDKLLVKQYDYTKYLISNIGEKYYFLKDFEIKQEIENKNLFSYKKFKQLKK